MVDFSDKFRNLPDAPHLSTAWEDIFQGHHLFPTAVANASDLLKYLAGHDRYDHRDFQTNGIWLPTDDIDANNSGFAKHLGPHPAYSEFVARILNDINTERVLNTQNGMSELEARERAVDQVDKFQLYLKEGLVAQIDPSSGAKDKVHPRFFLNAEDPQIPGGATDQDGLRELYDEITFESVKNSRVFTDASYRDALRNHSSLFDPNAKNAQGNVLNAFERAGLFDGDIEANIRALGFDRLNLNDVVKSADKKLGIFEMLIVGILGVAYVKSLINDAEANDLEQVIDDAKEAFTWDNALGAAVGVFGSVTTYGLATFFFGPIGFAAVLAFDFLRSVGDLADALRHLEQAFPDFEPLHIIQDVVQVIADTVDAIADAVLPDIPMPNVMVASGDMVGVMQDDTDILVGHDKATLIGGATNDLIIQFGTGNVFGGDGRDLIIATGSCEIDGGGGNDIVISFGANSKIDLGAGDDKLMHAGEGSIVYGGAGKDNFWYTDGILVDDADGQDSASWYGVTLGTALSFGAMEGGWAYFAGTLGLVRASVNSAGQLGVQDIISILNQSFDGADGDNQNYYMFFSNFNRDPLAEPEERTAGMRLANIEISAYQILKDPSDEQIQLREEHSTWELMSQMLHELFDLKNVDECTTDPLVLDLDGDGLELSSRTGWAPYFDVDGDGFLERSGWARGDDGMLVDDANANGKVDGFSELFGSPTASGFVELEGYDSNKDGKVDASDAKFASLMVWQDKDADGVTDAGELRSLSELGITSINVTATNVTKTNAGNAIAAEGTFTKSDGSTGTISDVRFDANQYDTKYAGDNSVDPTVAATMPNLKGHGTLANLQVALTQNPTGGLANTIASVLPTLNVIDIVDLRERALPILQAWAEAPLAGVPAMPGGNNPDVAILVDRSEVRTKIVNFAMQVTETVDINGTPTQVTYWKLASGEVRDAQGAVIPYPTLAQVLGQDPSDPDQSWDMMQGETIDFIERYFGGNIPFDDPDVVQSGAIGPISDFLAKAESAVELLSIRLAMQGPLAPYFEGVRYDVTEDCFRPTTDRQLTPMFEAIFEGAPSGAGATTEWLNAWQPILDNVLIDYERGGSLINSYAFLFTCIVAAHENVGLDIDVKSAAVTLGLPANLINTGSGLREGTEENDIFYMAAGDDVAEGGVGPDTYVFGKVIGHDVINDKESGANDIDQIRFAHLTEDDVTAYRDGRDLRLVVDATGETILVKDHFFEILPSLFGGNTQPSYGTDEIIFADGTVWDRMMISVKVSHPEDGNETIIGTDQVDVLDGGKGNDTLVGGNNSDVYVFGKGYGADVFDDQAGDHNILIPSGDILMLKDLNREDVTFSRGTDLNDLVIKIDGADDQVRINNQFSATYTGPFGTEWFQRIDYFSFANGEQVSWSQIIEQMNRDAGTDGDDTIYGFDYKDVLDGGKGNDTLSGANESDTYIFDVGYGHDLIHEKLDNILSTDEDRVLFGADVKASDVTFSRVGSSDDLLITLSDGSTLTVHDQFETHFMGGLRFDQVEHFEFASDPNATIHWNQLYEMLLQAAKTDGNDAIYGFDRNDIMDGGAGDDTLSGGDGSDTYIFNIGSGHDQVFDHWHNPLFPDYDMVQFGEGITLEDLDTVRSGDNLVITVKSTGDSLTLLDQLHWNQVDLYGVEAFKLFDGTVLGEEYFRAQLVRSTAGDDSIVGTSWADTIAGGTGNDSLVGGHGNDTYQYARGDGHDTITDSYDDGTGDRLVFSDVNSSDVTLVRNGNELTLVVAESAPGAGDVGSVLLNSALNDYLDRGIERFEFANGSFWTRSDVRVMLLAQASTAGNDTIVGFDVADTFTGGKGNDTITGGDGNDTYVYARGDGNDTIIESYDSLGRSGRSDKLVFTDINAADVSLSRVGNDVTLTIAESAPSAGDGGSVLMKDGLSTFYYTGVEQVVFANGTVWTQAVMRAMLVDAAGTPGNDTINGFSTNDVIEGGKGDDTIAGGDGSDTYLYARGDGNDSITESYDSLGRSGQADQLVFSDINATDVTLVRNDQTVTLVIAESAPGAGNGGSIVLAVGLSDFYYRGVEYIVFADGTTWTKQDMRQMLLDAASTDGDDTINGFTANDVITGGKGNDALNGADESDTYIYNRGDGHDAVSDGDGSADKLILHGISTFDITLGRSGNTAILNIAESAPGAGDGGSIAMASTYYNLQSQGVEQVIFDDGTIWTQAMLRGMWLAQESTSGDDQISGFDTDDTIIGEQGNDTINGAGGSDTITGGAGNDALGGSSSSDIYVYAHGDGDDTITEGIFDGAGDRLTLNGINVSDISVVRNGNDATLLIGESAPGAGDGGSVKLVNSFVIASNDNGVEQIAFADGTVWTSATLRAHWFSEVQTGGDDNISGFSTSEAIDGLAGNDTLTGGGGVDTLIGGIGNDTFLIDGDDVIIENTGEGTDTVQYSGTKTLGSNLENLTLLGTSSYSGIGNELDNVITGNTGANTLNGAAGNDTLDGGGGADNLKGGTGDDLYFVDHASDAVTESADEGQDQVKASVTHTLVANFEMLTLTGTGNINGTGNDLANVISGNAGNNQLNGGTGADTLAGGAGDDTYFVDDAGDVTTENAEVGTDLVQASVTYSLSDNVENLTLTGALAVNGTGNAQDNILIGNAAANALSGSAGNDSLDGAAGDDALMGGLGDDTYTVDSVNDAITEAAGEGNDFVKSGVTWTLGAYFERLTLTGSTAINGTGNELDNILTGNGGANSLGGGDGHDTLDGAAGNDTLSAGNGNDVLTGGTGNDAMSGGNGDDFYYVDSTSDTITENADEGNDVVQATASFTIAANIETLILAGPGNINGTGNAGDNIITGNGGNNILNGGAGVDTLTGGLGNDVYVIDTLSDQMIEAAGEGTDTVQIASTWTLADNFENLTLTGSSAVNATGNALNNTLTGNGAANVMTGGDGNDSILGNDGNDTVLGGAGDDWLDGDTGLDYLDGGDGNDTADYRYVAGTAFSFDLAAGTASTETMLSIENLYAGGGSDTINGSSVANLLNGGNGSDTINGLSGDDTLVGGGAGHDKLNGGDGNDWIDGGSGNDSYVGGAGDDWLVADSGTDSFDGGDGIDTVDFRYLTTAGTIDLVSNPGETITSVENLYSGSGADTLSGSAVANYINGGAGNDTVAGREGNDTLEGAAGNDLLNGEDGDDLLIWDGADSLNGGAGRDTLLFTSNGTILFDTTRMNNLEAIDLGKNDDNNGVTLSLADVLGLSSTSGGSGISAGGDDIDLFIFGDDQGEVRDDVNLSGGWSANGTLTTNAVTGSETTFNLYIASGVQVAVQQGLDQVVA